MFAGAKVVKIINGYEEKYGIERFDLAIDWGWFPFLTKPIFLSLESAGQQSVTVTGLPFSRWPIIALK